MGIFQTNHVFASFIRPGWRSSLVLFAGLFLTLNIAYITYQDEDKKADMEFIIVCREVKTKIETRLHAYAQLLIGSSAYFASSDTITRLEWKGYVEKIRIDNNLPGTQGIGYSQIITKSYLKDHITHIRKEGFPNYTIFPNGNRELYTSVVYIEPFTGRNIKAFGFDMYSEPIRRKAMNDARDNNKPTLSDKVMLVQENSEDLQTGTLMYMPVYRINMPVSTVDERRKAIKGWVYSPYLIKDLMHGMLGQWDSTRLKIHLRLYDGEIVKDKLLLYDSQPGFQNYHHSRSTTLFINFEGKKWGLVFTQPHFFFSYFSNKVLIVWVSGVIISLLLYFLTLALFNTRDDAKRIAEKLTLDLREAEHRFTLFMDHLPAIAFLKDENGRALFINKYMDKALSTTGWIGKNMAEVLQNDIGRRMLSDDMEVMKSGYLKIEETIPHNDGNFHSYETQKFLINGYNGKKYLGGIALEITERLKYQRELQKWAHIFEHAQWGIVVGSADGSTIETINPAFARMHGYTKKEITGKPIVDVFAPECRKDVPVNISLAHKKGHHLWESVHIKKNGTRFPVLIDVTAVKDSDGNVLYRVVNVMDITERKKIEKTLKESEEKYHHIFDNAGDVIFIHDKDAKIMAVNSTACKVYGYTREEILTMHVNDIDHEKENKNTLARIDELMRKEFLNFETQHVRKDGSVITMDVSSKRILYNGEQVVMSICRDITERKKTELELRANALKLKELNATKDKLFSVIAHDLRNPFNTILGFINLSLADIEENKFNDLGNMLGKINATAENTMVLLDNLLNWAKSQTGQMSFNPGRYRMKDIAQEIIRVLSTTCEIKNITLSYREIGDVYVFADADMLKTILRNLISNAIKFSANNGSVIIEASYKGSSTRIEVTDNGIGMSEEISKGLFTIHSTITRKGTANEKGSGLGLLLCREFINNHGGNIQVFSKPGEGSSFIVTLPESHT